MSARDIEVLDVSGYSIRIGGIYLGKTPLNYKRVWATAPNGVSLVVWITKSENRHEGTAHTVLVMPNQELFVFGLNASTAKKFDKGERGMTTVIGWMCRAAGIRP
jgi:hypothetical protein